MSKIGNLRNSIDETLQEKQSLLTANKYNKFWREIAENWDSYENLKKIEKRILKIKPSKIQQLRNELKSLKDDKLINPNIKLNQSEAKLREILNNYKNPLKFDSEDNEALFSQTKEKKKIKIPTITEVKKFRTTLTETKFENDDDVEWGYKSLNILYHTIPLIRKAIKEHHNIKVSFHIGMMFEHKNSDDFREMSHSVRSITTMNQYEIKDKIDGVSAFMKTFIPEIEAKDTGLVFRYIKYVYCNISKYRPWTGGSYIELDEYLSNKKCCINIKNEDNKCLMYCVLYHINKDKIKKDPQRVTKYKPYENQFDFSKIKFPVSITDISKVEQIIDHGINVFIYDDKCVYSIRTTTRRDEKIINLLMLKNKNTEHYVYVSKLDVLIRKNKFDENGNHVSKKTYPCPNCLHNFSTNERLMRHRENGCDLFEPQRTEIPSMIKNEKTNEYETPTIKFKHFNNKFKSPVVIYADFETICKKIEHNHNHTKSCTTKFVKQEPCGYCFNVVSDYPDLNFGMKLYRGENTVKHFLKKLMDCGDEVKKILETNNQMIITEEQEQEFLKCEECHICGENINDDIETLQRVRDHDHTTGLYRGCAHQKCNLNFNEKNYKIPVYFHNLKGFDGHLIIKELNNMNFENVKIIAQNFEKYVTFGFKNFQFLDSFAFLSSSLDTLSSNLLKSTFDKKTSAMYQSFEDEENTHGFFNEVMNDETLLHKVIQNAKTMFKYSLKDETSAKEQQLLILQKGVYPYEFMDSFDKFKETELPPIKEFYSNLNEDEITHKDYQHALNVWNKFNIKNLGEYHDLYLKTDVLLLTDVFENFRETAMKFYDLDPCRQHYFTLPSFAWDAMLKKTGIELEQLTDIDKYIFCEKGLRGGISMISHRYARANNKYMKEYNVDDVSSYIVYLDANNLYGHAMIQKLPFGGFKWYDFGEINELNRKYLHHKFINPLHTFINNLNCDDEDGYFVECDLHYPKELHDSHNSYPLAPEKKSIKKSELSPYQLNQLETHNEKHCETIEKLVPNFNDKEKYVCHIRNLKYYIEKGLVITKIHRILQFKQSDWLKSYIDFNTTERAKSKNDFEKDFFKLMNNAVFGKTMENMRNRVDIRLFTDEKKAMYQIAKPQYETHKIYGENLIAIKQLKKVVELNKPIYVGLTVLDLSKLHMYDFHYDYIIPKYGDSQQLLFTDTDSLCYHIQTEDIYKDMYEDKHLFDMSGYEMDGYRSRDNTNKKVIGKFKDETEGNPIIEFCGLRSKMYSIKTEDGEEKKTGKGIKKSALKKKINHENYLQCLFPNGAPSIASLFNEECKTRQLVSFNNMRSINHDVYGFKFTRVGLSCSNDKQYLLDDGITSYSYGHYKIPTK